MKKSLYAYLRYKSNSSDLFKTIERRDLENLHTWKKNEIEEYDEFLRSGYTRNIRCQQGRILFRDNYIKEEDRDLKHEIAIEEAQRLVEVYASLMIEFQIALKNLPRSEQTSIQESCTKFETKQKKKKNVKEIQNSCHQEMDDYFINTELQKDPEIKATMKKIYLNLMYLIIDKMDQLKIDESERSNLLVDTIERYTQRPWTDSHDIYELVSEKVLDDIRLDRCTEKLILHIIIKSAILKRKTIRDGVFFDPNIYINRDIMPNFKLFRDAITIMLLLGPICSSLSGIHMEFKVSDLVLTRESIISITNTPVSKRFPTIFMADHAPDDIFNSRAMSVASFADRLMHNINNINVVEMKPRTLFRAVEKKWGGRFTFNTRHFGILTRFFIAAANGLLRWENAIIDPAKFFTDIVALQLNTIPKKIVAVVYLMLMKGAYAMTFQSWLDIYYFATLLLERQHPGFAHEYKRTATLPRSDRGNPFEFDKENEICRATIAIRTKQSPGTTLL